MPNKYISRVNLRKIIKQEKNVTKDIRNLADTPTMLWSLEANWTYRSEYIPVLKLWLALIFVLQNMLVWQKNGSSRLAVSILNTLYNQPTNFEYVFSNIDSLCCAAVDESILYLSDQWLTESDLVRFSFHRWNIEQFTFSELKI